MNFFTAVIKSLFVNVKFMKTLETLCKLVFVEGFSRFMFPKPVQSGCNVVSGNAMEKVPSST